MADGSHKEMLQQENHRYTVGVRPVVGSHLCARNAQSIREISLHNARFTC